MIFLLWCFVAAASVASIDAILLRQSSVAFRASSVGFPRLVLLQVHTGPQAPNPKATQTRGKGGLMKVMLLGSEALAGRAERCLPGRRFTCPKEKESERVTEKEREEGRERERGRKLKQYRKDQAHDASCIAWLQPLTSWMTEPLSTLLSRENRLTS